MIYLIGSMRNPRIPLIAKQLRSVGLDVFDDWFSPGPNADDEWQRYEQLRERTYMQALAGQHAEEVFEFDRAHLNKASLAVLATPAGKSGHLELGYIIGQGKPGYILLHQEPERFDIMYRFATAIAKSTDELIILLKENKHVD